MQYLTVSRKFVKVPVMVEKAYKLAELAVASETPPRTIRFYIAQGILQGPVMAGRAAVYGGEHLARLKQIAELKQQGLTLAEIGGRLNAGGAAPELPRPCALVSYAIADDVTVTVRSDIAPWRMNRIRTALSELSARLKRESDNADDQD